MVLCRPDVVGDANTQKTRGIDPMLFQCWPAVIDAGPTFKQHWVYDLCFIPTQHRSRSVNVERQLKQFLEIHPENKMI